MAIEIEAKLRVDELAPVRAQLKKVGGKFVESVWQKDIYFDTIQERMKNGDFALRLRNEVSKKGTKTLLTYKGPRQGTKLKSRTEIELGVDDEEAAVEVLGQLGFHKSLVVEKSREIFEFKGCQVGLDDVKGLGTFVEIEGPGEEVIEQVQQDIGLGASEHIKESYASLIEDLPNSN